MTHTALAVQTGSATLSLTVPRAASIERNPAAVYLVRLASSSRRVMHDVLDMLASVLTGGQADALTCAWATVRYQHSAALSRGDVRELFDVCAMGNQALAIRDAAILAVQYAAGLRRAEVVGLDLHDLERTTSALKIHGMATRNAPATWALAPDSRSRN